MLQTAETASVATHAVSKIRGLRWYICALLFFVTFINYVDRVSLGAITDAVRRVGDGRLVPEPGTPSYDAVANLP